MNWYYMEQGKQAGPFSNAQFDALQKAGTITLDTWVWHEEMLNWTPLRQLKPAVRPPPIPASTFPPIAPHRSKVVCAECGGVFQMEETLQHGNLHICATCKPLFLQKLSAVTGTPAGELKYARILTRFDAVLLDGLILMIANTAINFSVFGTISPDYSSDSPQVALIVLLVLATQIGIAAAYETIMVGGYGATLGKMACRIKVVTADGGPVSYPRALGRFFAKALSNIMCLLGNSTACFDRPQKRALQDYLCNTRVIEK